MAQNNSGRKKPNILVTGTPGTGKTTTSSFLAEATQLRHINVGDLVRDKKLHDGWDEQLDCHVINEDLLNNLELAVNLPKRGNLPGAENLINGKKKRKLLCMNLRTF